MDTNKSTRKNDEMDELTEEERMAVEGIGLLMSGPTNERRSKNQFTERRMNKREQKLKTMNLIANLSSTETIDKNSENIGNTRNEFGKKNTVDDVPLLNSQDTSESPPYLSFQDFNMPDSVIIERRDAFEKTTKAYKNYDSRNRIDKQNRSAYLESKVKYDSLKTIDNKLGEKKDPIYVIKGKLEVLLSKHQESNEYITKYEKKVISDFIGGLEDTIQKKQINRRNKKINGPKKENHLESEHTRRDAINMGIEVLSKLLPIESNKSKMMVIFNAVLHLLELKVDNTKRKKKEI